MDLYTRTIRFCRASEIPIVFEPNEKLESLHGLNERLRIVLIKQGTGILSINGERVSVVAPAILCINEREDVCAEVSIELKVQALYFHPEYINSNLNFEKIHGLVEEELITNRQDIFLFKPFVTRNEAYSGIFNIDFITMKRISNLLIAIKYEIEEQSHRSWSCCARSYFLELLFTLTRVYESPKIIANSVIKNSSTLADEVILFLNSNYGSKITIAELCGVFNTNKTTLQEQFHNSTGQSVMAYLISLRVNLAALILKDTALSVSEIAERMGFSDSNHFNKIFSKSTGYSPNQYRKQFKSIR